MQDKKSTGTSGLFRLWLIVSMTIAWGANWPFIKIAVSEVPVFTVRFWALIVGGIGLFLIAAFRGAPLRLRRVEWIPLSIVSLTNVTIWHLFSAIGIGYMGAGHASILGFTMPLWVAFVAYLWGGEKVTKTNIAGLLLGMAGLGCLLYPKSWDLINQPIGPTVMILGAIAWAVGTVGMRRFRFSLPVISLTAWQLIIGSAPLLVGSLIWENDFQWTNVSAKAYLSLGYMSLIAVIYGNWAWFRIVALYPPMVAGISSLAIPVIGILSAVVLLREPLGYSEISALFLISAAQAVVLIIPRMKLQSTKATAMDGKT